MRPVLRGNDFICHCIYKNIFIIAKSSLFLLRQILLVIKISLSRSLSSCHVNSDYGCSSSAARWDGDWTWSHLNCHKQNEPVAPTCIFKLIYFSFRFLYMHPKDLRLAPATWQMLPHSSTGWCLDMEWLCNLVKCLFFTPTPVPVGAYVSKLESNLVW